MSADISAYPVLDDRLVSCLRYDVLQDYKFYYVRGDEERSLEPEILGDGSLDHKLSDVYGEWDPDRDNLGVRRSYSFQNYGCLFGENGIACTDAVIGVAVIWTSADSKQRGSIKVGNIRITEGENQQPVRMKLEHEFGTASLRGMVEFDTVLYIAEAGDPKENEAYLANKSGMVLGTLDRFQIQLDGNGSMFPIYEVNEPGQPLWYVRCTWDDPAYDLFSESVTVCINKAHRNYKYLDRTKKLYDPQLMIEIMADALNIIVTKLRMDPEGWDNTQKGTDIQPGSVSEAGNYFITALEWDVTSPETTAITIRKFFDKKDFK